MTDEERARDIADWAGDFDDLQARILTALTAVREEERERCSKIADQFHRMAEIGIDPYSPDSAIGRLDACTAIASAIRTQTEQP